MATLTSRGGLQPVDEIVFRDLLRDAFPNPQRFGEFLRFRLNKRWDDYYAMNADYPQAIRQVVEQANGSLWWRDLLREARNAIPSDPGLVGFAEGFDQAPIAVSGTKQTGSKRLTATELELRVKEANPVLDILVWRRRLGEIEGRVCRVEFPAGTPKGTGFLVGPNVVMTNYHVIEPIRQGLVPSSAIVLRFDYKVLSDGVTVGTGKTYALTKENWLIDESAYSPADLEVSPTEDAAPDKLDYVLLAVAGSPGSDAVGGDTNDPNPVQRGWIEVPATAHEFDKQKALFIVQHPDKMPMQVALDTEAVIGLNGNKTRVRYTTTTQPGSSGSPCFNVEWEWVALHHAGDPKYHQIGVNPEFNQGIPLTAILNRLNALGKGAVLGGGV